MVLKRTHEVVPSGFDTVNEGMRLVKSIRANGGTVADDGNLSKREGELPGTAY